MHTLKPQTGFDQQEPPSDEVVLAAVQRAALHHPHGDEAVARWAILDHLAAPPRSREARHVIARVGALQERGRLTSSTRHGVPVWALTSAGQRQLRDARRDGLPLELPEAPQHRAWRNARTLAAQEIERFRADVRERLNQGSALLDAPEPPHSDAWLELAEELRQACRRLGAASHCLHEWPEPNDDAADVDERLDTHDTGDTRDLALDPTTLARRRTLRTGRRNITLWGTRP